MREDFCMSKINLADLKNDPEVLKNLMSIVKPPKVKVEKASKKKKIKVKVPKPEESIVIIDEPEDTPEKEVKVKNDNDFSTKHQIVRKMVDKAEAQFNQSEPFFTSMEILFSSAYRYADMKNRLALASARRLCKDAIALTDKKERAKAKAKSKGNRLDRTELKKYSLSTIKKEMEKLFLEIHENLKLEDRKFAGNAYDDIHTKYKVDLALTETASAGVVMARADLMVTVGNFVDLDDVKRTTTHIGVERIEGSIFAIRNALIVGFATSALPKKSDEALLEAALEASMANNFQVRATPLAKPLRHYSSNRTWFYVPEYSRIVVKSISFADRSLNREFEALKSLSNSPTEDDIRFLFLRTGIDEDQVNTIVRRWKSSDSYQGRISILTNEYNAVVRLQKNARLRAQRQQFLESNHELLDNVRVAKARIDNIDVEKAEIKTEFAQKASHTGNVEQGLPISQYRRLTEAFHSIEKVAVRGNTSSYERIRIRNGIRRDRIRCRVLKQDFTEISEEGKKLKRKIESIHTELDRKRNRAFNEMSGKT